jgi:uncharacterized alkaline shock family protein YloU
MSENAPANIQLENGNGTITFADDVVATIAGLAANEVEGVTSMGGGSAGLVDILSRKQSNRSLTRGVKVEISDGEVVVHLTIVSDYGSPIPEVTGNIQENVKKAIETMSGLTVKSVDVYVQAVSFEREKTTAVELEMKQRLMLQKEHGAEARRDEPDGGRLKIDSPEAETDAPDHAPVEDE